jgi:hypothetical protein
MKARELKRCGLVACFRCMRRARSVRGNKDSRIRVAVVVVRRSVVAFRAFSPKMRGRPRVGRLVEKPRDRIGARAIEGRGRPRRCLLAVGDMGRSIGGAKSLRASRRSSWSAARSMARCVCCSWTRLCSLYTLTSGLLRAMRRDNAFASCSLAVRAKLSKLPCFVRQTGVFRA